MPYSESALDAMQYDPVAMRAYFWRVASGMKRSALATTAEVIKRGEVSNTQRFGEVYARDGEERRWAGVQERVSTTVLENMDVLVANCLLRPPVCPACRTNT